MRKLWVLFIVATFAVTQAVLCKAQSSDIAFTHVAVVDVLNGQIEPDMTVLISHQEISEVGSSKVVRVPKQVRSIDARGKYLIPGLWDMHVHSLWDSKRPATFFPLFLANGVTD